jgi:hypothetical protein
MVECHPCNVEVVSSTLTSSTRMYSSKSVMHHAVNVWEQSPCGFESHLYSQISYSSVVERVPDKDEVSSSNLLGRTKTLHMDEGLMVSRLVWDQEIVSSTLTIRTRLAYSLTVKQLVHGTSIVRKFESSLAIQSKTNKTYSIILQDLNRQR